MKTLVGLGCDIKAGRADPLDLTEMALEQARAENAVFISLRRKEALREAEESRQRQRAGRRRSLLDGVPIAWKDVFDIKGERTTAGSVTRRDLPRARRDATVVAAARERGLIAVGKTNLSELAFSGLGLNPHFGTPIADFSVTSQRVPGGSSSGSAIAVQRAIVMAAIGTDTAGSIRVPAAFNGLIGFKASRSRYPLTGVVPLAPSCDSLGPIAQTVEDCVWLDALLRGLQQPKVMPKPLCELAFRVDEKAIEDPETEPAVLHNLEAVVQRLRDEGACVAIGRIPALEQAANAIRTHGWLGAIEAHDLYGSLLDDEQRSVMDPRVAKRLAQVRQLEPEAARHLHEKRPALMEELRRDLAGAILIAPTVRHVAPPLIPLDHDPELFARVNLATLALTMPGSFLDMPGLALPSGRDEVGLPTSVLFSVPSNEDDRLLAAGLSVDGSSEHAECKPRTLISKDWGRSTGRRGVRSVIASRETTYAGWRAG